MKSDVLNPNQAGRNYCISIQSNKQIYEEEREERKKGRKEGKEGLSAPPTPPTNMANHEPEFQDS